MTVLVTTVLKMFMILKPPENILSVEKWFVSKNIYGVCNLVSRAWCRTIVTCNIKYGSCNSFASSSRLSKSGP